MVPTMSSGFGEIPAAQPLTIEGINATGPQKPQKSRKRKLVEIPQVSEIVVEPIIVSESKKKRVRKEKNVVPAEIISNVQVEKVAVEGKRKKRVSKPASNAECDDRARIARVLNDAGFDTSTLSIECNGDIPIISKAVVDRVVKVKKERKRKEEEEEEKVPVAEAMDVVDVKVAVGENEEAKKRRPKSVFKNKNRGEVVLCEDKFPNVWLAGEAPEGEALEKSKEVFLEISRKLTNYMDSCVPITRRNLVTQRWMLDGFAFKEPLDLDTLRAATKQ